MSMSCRIDPELGIVYTTLIGKVSTPEVIETLRRVIDSPDYRPGLDGLVDLRESRHAPKSDEIREVASIMVNHHEQIGHSRSALVVASDLGYGLARMYQAIAEGSSIETHIFRDMDEARHWLGLPPLSGDLQAGAG